MNNNPPTFRSILPLSVILVADWPAGTVHSHANQSADHFSALGILFLHRAGSHRAGHAGGLIPQHPFPIQTTGRHDHHPARRHLGRDLCQPDRLAATRAGI